MADYIQVQDHLPGSPAEAQYVVGSAGQTQFSFPYVFWDDDDLIVRVNGVVQVLGTDYTVTGEMQSGGGEVVLTTKACNAVVEIWRDTPVEKLTGFPIAGPLSTKALNNELSRQVAIDQDTEHKVDRAIKKPRFDQASMDLEDKDTRKNKLLGFDNKGGVVTYDRTVSTVGLETGPVPNVVDYGAVGNGVTDDSAAVAAAIAASLDGRIYYPKPPGGDGYLHTQDFGDPAGVYPILGPGASLIGAHDLIRAKQTLIKGARVLDPTLTVSTVFPNNGRYNHQCVAGFDLDDALIVSWQRNLFIHIESFDYREVVFAKTTDGPSWQTWTDPVNPFVDASVCTNPITITNGRPRMGAAWIANHARAPIKPSQKLWIGCTTTADPDTNARFLVAHKTTAAGMFTVYSFWQNINTGQIKLFLGDAKPGADWTARFTHEGHPDLNFWCHATMFDSRGRLLMSTILGDQINDNFGNMRRLPSVLYSEDTTPEDPTEIAWKLGPSVDLGTTNGPGPQWEWGMYEARPNFFEAIIRHNEGEGGAGDNYGRRQFSGIGDGVTLGGWRETGTPMHRTRVKYIGLNDKFAATAMVDRFANRSNGVLAFKERGGALIPGPIMSPGEPETAKSETIEISGPTDTVLSTSLDFTAATVEARVKQSGSDKELVGSGFIADYAGDTIDLAHWRFLETGHTFIAENGGFVETLDLPNNTATQILSLTNDLTTAAPVVIGLNEKGNDTLTIGDSVFVDTATDNVTFTGATDTYSGLLVYEPGAIDSLVYSTVTDTLWGTTLDITDGDLSVYMVQNVVGATFEVPELDFITDTAGSAITLLDGESAGDEVVITAATGRRWQVPTLVKDEKTGRVVQVGSLDYLNESIGREPTATWFEPDDLPRADYLNVVLRKNAAAEWADNAHLPTYDDSTGLATIPGDGSAVHSLPPRRGQLAVPYQHNTLPSGNKNIILFVLGTPQQHLTVELADQGLWLVREYKIGRNRGGRAKFDARDEEVTRRLEAAVNVDQVFTFQYDPERNLVMINDRLFKLQWPFALYWGNGFLMNEEPSATSRVLTVDVKGVTWTPLPEEFSFEADEDERPPAPNLIIDPGFDFDPVKGGGSDYVLADDMPLLPGLSCYKTGGATATLRQASNSVDASEAQFDGLRHSLLLTISAAGSDWLELDFEFDGAQSVSQGPYSFAIWAANESGPAVGEANHADGIAARLTWVHNLGRGAASDQQEAVGFARIPRFNDRLWYPIVVPQANETFENVIGPESFAALRFGIEPGRVCVLRFRGADFYQGNAPRRMPRPDLVEVERRIKRFYYRWDQEKLTAAVPIQMFGDGTNALGVFRFPQSMRSDNLTFLDSGPWLAIGDTAGQVPVGLSQVVSEKDRATLRASPSTTQTFANGEDVLLLGIDPADASFNGDGSQYRFEVTSFEAESEGDIGVTLSSTAGDTVLSPGTDYFFSEQYGPPVDQPPVTPGQTLFSTQMSIDGLTAVDVVKINPTSGYETLDLGTDISIDTSTYPHSCELLGGDTIGASDTFVIENDRKAQGFGVVRPAALPVGHSLKVSSKSQSANFLAWSAQTRRYSSAAELVFALSGFDAETDTKRALARAVDESNEAGFWTTRDWIHVYMLGSSTNQTPALLNLTGNATHNGSAANSPAHTPGVGYTLVAASSQRINANQDPSAGGFNFTLNNAEFSLFVVDQAPTGAANYLCGMGSNKTGISPLGTSNTYNVRCNSAIASAAVVPFGPVVGFQSVGRADASNIVYTRQLANGMIEQITIAQVSTSLGTTAYVGQLPGAGYGSGTVAMAMVGSALTADQRYVASRAMNKLYNFFRG